jgi:hypothetical protein
MIPVECDRFLPAGGIGSHDPLSVIPSERIERQLGDPVPHRPVAALALVPHS